MQVEMRKASSWLVVAVLVAGLGVVGASRVASAAPKQVAIEGNAFVPAALTVSAGETVVWTNKDTAPHTVTVTAGPAKFSSPTLKKGDTFSFTFEKPGTYNYYCAIHPDMKGALTASPLAAAPTPEPAPSHRAKPVPVPAPAPPPPAPQPAPTAPAANPAPAPSPAVDEPAPPASGANCRSGSAISAALEPFLTHLAKAHLEESPGEQAADLLDADQYVKTHTVLAGDMAFPAAAAAMAAPDGLAPFVTHVDHAHLEESPGEQAADLLDADQYVKTHTVLVGDMASPTTAAVFGSAGC